MTIQKKIVLAMLLLAALACAALSGIRSQPPAQNPGAARLRPGSPPAGIKINRNVVYGTVDGVDLKMDLYLPEKPASNPDPAVIFVHGGGWTAGDKAQVGPGATGLASRGFIVGSVNYRLAPKYHWPAQIQDVKCAIRFLRAHAADYHLDPNRIGVWGASAGGHLVALLGTAGPNAGFDKSGGYLDQSSRVQAVVDMFGPTDLTGKDFSPAARSIIRAVFGEPDRVQNMLIHASPVTYIARNDPPFLILQGDRDMLVPPAQSQELYDRLKAAGVPVTLVMVKNAGHSFQQVGGQPISPPLRDLAFMVDEFFRKTLGRR